MRGVPAWKSLSLQSRFSIGLVAAALGMGGIFFAILYFHMQSIVVNEVRDRANLMLDQVNAVQAYVRTVLRPKMYDELHDDRFVIEAMSSSYISRKIMERAQQETDFIYRRVALNARNPKSEPSYRELDLISYFQKHPQRTRLEELVDVDGRKVYLCARPVVFKQSCMHCHGSPGRAPRELIDRYGADRGFSHQPDTIAGLVSIRFPMHQAVLSIKEATFSYIFFYVVAVILFFSMVHIHFRRLVVFNLKRLTSIFHRNFPEHGTEHVQTQSTNDEVDDLIDGFEQITNHLFAAREQLKEYAANLEDMVEERTRDLHCEADERKADVYLFVHTLDALRSSLHSQDLLHETLGLIGQRFRARRICYFCTQFSNRIYSWPEDSAHPELPEDFLDLALANTVRRVPEGYFVPVQSQEQVWGVLYLDLDPGTHPKRVSDQILLALGQQLAIAMENIQAFHSLMHQKKLLESIFEGIADPLLLVDGNASILLANQAAKELMQDEAGDGPGQELFPVLGLDADDKERALDLVAKSLNRRESWSEEVRLSKNRSFQISIYPIVGAHQPRGLAVCSLREVTAERQMMRQLQQAEKLTAVGKLAAGLAHEINNPLGTILCYVNLLKTDLEGEQSREDLEVIERHTKRAQKILQDLLDFARPKAAGSGRCRINRTIRHSAQFFRVQAEKKDVHLELDLDERDPVVGCAETVMEQVLSNLLLNALEAVPVSGWIRIRSRKIQSGGDGISHAADGSDHKEKDVVPASGEDDGLVLVHVEDNGPGIPEDLMDTVFDPFFSTKEVGRGTGLGLAIVYGLVQDVGGRIEVVNTPGARFSVFLPDQGAA